MTTKTTKREAIIDQFKDAMLYVIDEQRRGDRLERGVGHILAGLTKDQLVQVRHFVQSFS